MNLIIRNIERLLIIFFLLLTASMVVLKLYQIDLFHYVIWGDRDVSRSMLMSEFFLVSGSETNGREGTRIPGGAIHYVNWGLASLSSSPLFIYAVVFLASLLSALFLYDLGNRLNGPLAGVTALIIFVSSGGVAEHTLRFYNPLYGVPFTVAAFYFLSRFVLEKRNWQFTSFVACAALAAQMQMAVLYLVVLGLLFLILFCRPISAKTWGFGLIAALLLYSPWIIHEVFGLFESTSALPDITNQYVVSTVFTWDSILAFLKSLPHILMSRASLGEPESFSLQMLLPWGACLLGGFGLFILWNAKGREHAHLDASEVRRLTFYFGFLFFLVVGFMFVYDLSLAALGQVGRKARYEIFIFPAAAMLTGLGFSLLIQHWFRASGAWTVKLGVLAIAGVIAIRSAFMAYADFRRDAHGIGENPQYRVVRAMIMDIHETFGYGSEKIKLKTGFVYHQQGRWRARVIPLQYIIDELALPDSAAAPEDACLAVVVRDSDTMDRYFSPEQAEKALKSLPTLSVHTNHRNLQIPPYATSDGKFLPFAPDVGQDLSRNLQIDRLIAREKYVLVSYRWPAHGCLKSFMNPYTLTAAERDIEETLLPQTPALQEKQSPDGTNLFYIRHPLPDPRYPVTVRLDLRTTKPGHLQATLHSKQLRNSEALLNGYFENRAIGRPRLELTSDSGSKFELVLYPGALGASAFQTPWTSPNVPVGIGPFRASLVFDDTNGTHRFLLTDRLNLGS